MSPRGPRAATRSLEIARRSWPAYLPWPASLLAEVDLEEGDLDQASEGFQHAFELGCQFGDPCWEAMAARGIGRVEAAHEERRRGDRLAGGCDRSCGATPRTPTCGRRDTRSTPCAPWPSSMEPGMRRGGSPTWSLAARTGMRELLARAYLHRCRLGDMPHWSPPRCWSTRSTIPLSRSSWGTSRPPPPDRRSVKTGSDRGSATSGSGRDFSEHRKWISHVCSHGSSSL